VPAPGAGWFGPSCAFLRRPGAPAACRLIRFHLWRRVRRLVPVTYKTILDSYCWRRTVRSIYSANRVDGDKARWMLGHAAKNVDAKNHLGTGCHS
jgi:hypothetical protein